MPAAPAAPAGALRRLGQGSIRFRLPPRIVAGYTVVGPMEGKGPMAGYMDTVLEDTYYGERCWERTESKMLKEAVQNALRQARLQEADVDLSFTADMLGQLVASSFAMRSSTLPHVGIYSACASFAGALALAGMAVEGGFARRAVVAASSHHDAAERQYRFPTELGVQRPPTSQWTVTGAGAVVVSGEASDQGILVAEATFGRVMDMGIKDPFDMGTAMAPAAADTLVRHLQHTGRRLEEFDLVLTGDLGRVGSRVFLDWLEERHGVSLDGRHSDCGALLYNPARQDVHSGGSGLGASACTVSGYLLKAMNRGLVGRVLLVGTGCLHSQVTHFQGESIPVVAHAVTLERPGLAG
ncbi:MAG TPA: stage V sporulation protein AD [Limnochordales bacterium]